MSFLQNSRSISTKIFLLAFIFTAGNFFYASASYAQTAPANEALRILERWTSAHWGQDCFVWVVHYPEEIIAPWVEAEAQRSNMSSSERERFRSDFVSELKLNTSETFLVSIYSFGSRPVNISPADENISLFTASGQRIKPSGYSSTLDYPSAGVVQGLVFFPKQRSKDYVIAIRGMSLNERIFSFAPPEVKEPVPVKEEPKPEMVVVNLPKRQPKKKAEPEKPATPPPPPMIPQKPLPTLFKENSSDMDAFVKSVQERGKTPETQAPVKAAAGTSRPSNTDSSYVSRESVLRRFLALWADNNAQEMYEMLSDSSKKQISRLNFARAVAKDTAFMSGLKNDYKIDWIGEERAKVITTSKTLVFKSVTSRTLGITREGSSWRVVW